MSNLSDATQLGPPVIKYSLVLYANARMTCRWKLLTIRRPGGKRSWAEAPPDLLILTDATSNLGAASCAARFRATNVSVAPPVMTVQAMMLHSVRRCVRSSVNVISELFKI